MGVINCILNAADVFALPSHNENFGNVYLESLAAGTPILASKHTPWSIVEQFGCGQWVNNDEVSVTNALKLLFEGDAYHLHKKIVLNVLRTIHGKKFSGNYF
uniref:Glycosyltransferase n=1 Tax=Escherichia coli TaxID=562 RepID=A0A6N0IQV4_ECOLX|nr:glycosyltransferase [Escherichia coli]